MEWLDGPDVFGVLALTLHAPSCGSPDLTTKNTKDTKATKLRDQPMQAWLAPHLFAIYLW